MAENRVENDFENDVQDKGNDFVDAGNGFIYSFLFFTVIFAIGVTISVIAR
ncbi:MAG TPA: YqzM family protein [Bacillales bacterium]|nr:YqzM family protein [Bacillales bacterium]